MRKILVLFFIIVFLPACSARRIFYYPNAHLYWDPHQVGLEYEIVEYPSLNGKKLTGLYFPTKQKPKGTIVHCHGNAANVSNHFPFSVFLLQYGFDVLIFDYQGFGGSEGKPSAQNTIEDGIASVHYAQSRLSAPSSGVCLFGQSVGAAVATVVAAQEPLVRGVVLEAGFTSYRDITQYAMRRSFITWPFSFFLPTLLVRHRYDPIDYIPKISPRPVLFVHGTKDRVIPLSMSKKLYQAAGQPKELYIVRDGQHLEYRRQDGIRYEKKIADFFTEALSSE